MATNAPYERPTAAFVLSLLAGLWMLAMGGWLMSWSPTNSQWGWGGMGGMMGGGWMWGHGVLGLWWPWFGLLAGIVVLVGAVILYSRPSSAPAWGIVILIASALNLFVGMGGFLASVLGIIGGALALSWRPQT
jgi:hypothetical protein